MCCLLHCKNPSKCTKESDTTIIWIRLIRLGIEMIGNQYVWGLGWGVGVGGGSGEWGFGVGGDIFLRLISYIKAEQVTLQYYNYSL